MRISPIKVSILLIILMLVLIGAASAAEQKTDGAAVTSADLMKLPLVFIPNQGQADPAVLYQAKAEAHSIFFTKDNVVLATVKDDKPVSFSTTVAGINPAVTVTGVDPQQGTANFYIGNDPKDWQTGIPTYGGVEYQSVLPGIDLTYKGNNGLLKREFTIAPGADPAAIVITYSGIDSITYGPEGTLEVSTSSGMMTEAAPVAYQVINGQQVAVAAQYNILGAGKVGFNIGSYDKSSALVIDPQLQYSSYLGGALNDHANGIAVDSAGNAYVTGYTSSTNFPAVAAWNWTPNGYADVFLTKVSPDGKDLIYSTYFGGNATDVANGIALDDLNQTYITGYTESLDFPVTGAQKDQTDNNADAFIIMFDQNGQNPLSSCFGGNRTDVGTAIAVDNWGGGHEAYITGYTNSPNFPQSGGGYTQAFNKGVATSAYDAFLLIYIPTTNATMKSTYFGGSDNDWGQGIAVNQTSYNVYITGWTQSTNLTTLTPVQGYNKGGKDAFVAKFDNAYAQKYTTYLGGEGNDEGRGIAVQNIAGQEYAYVTGVTYSLTFPIQSPFHPFFGPNSYTSQFGDAFITKLQPGGNGINWSSYLGGQNSDGANSIVLDSNNNVYVTGYTNSIDFPVKNSLPAFGTKHAFTDIFVTMVNSDLKSLNFSTYFGGGLDEVGTGVAVSDIQNIFVSGYTSSYDFPTWNSYKVLGQYDGKSYQGWDDAFVMHFTNLPSPAPPVANFTFTVGNCTAPLTVFFMDNSTGVPTNWDWNFGDSLVNLTGNYPNPTHVYAAPGNYLVTLTVSNSYPPASSIQRGPIPVVIPPGPKFTDANSTTAIGRILVAENHTRNISLYLNTTPTGLLGYNMTVGFNNTVNANFTGIGYPGWMPAPQTEFIPMVFDTTDTFNATFQGIDYYNNQQPGATNIRLANFTVRGNQSGTAILNITNVTMLQDDIPLNLTLCPTNYNLTVDVRPILQVPLPPFWVGPAIVGPPQDLNGDGLYEDINGDGVADFTDVSLFFQDLSWIQANEYYEFFDFYPNGSIGFDDVFALFHML